MSALPAVSVIDACFGIKLVLEEEHSQHVNDYLMRLLDIPPVQAYVPDLFFIECSNILWKHVNRGLLPREAAENNCQILLELSLPTIAGMELMPRSLSLACDYKISAYDATYLALAEKLQLPLLTADNRFAAAMVNSPYQVIALDNFFA
ncbi:MAG: type II toxin-antitoxin system VapC family toxin [bacterium]